MRKLLISAATCLALCTVASAQQANSITLSKTQPLKVVLPATSIPAEDTAAQELKHYLGQITGVQSEIVREGQTAPTTDNVIYVGSTQFAAKQVKDYNTLADEEWVMQTQGKALILTGGRPRGALYATYRFLEDVGGVSWWNPWEETVPQRPTLTVANLNRRGKPAFRYRDIYSLYGVDNGRFAARSRINRQGYAPIGIEYGWSRAYGPPAENHTFYRYLPPEQYYKDHPDWYIFAPGTPLDTGKFPHIQAQLNVSNKEMRQEFLRVLRENIRASRKDAIEKNLPPPDTFDVSQNDGGTVTWVGEADKELVAREGSNSASMVDFLNFLADGIRDEFPDVYLSTLAYHSGEKAPKTLKVRDNVIIRLTDTQSNVIQPVTAERNHTLRKNLDDWGKLAKNLRIWDYNLTFIHPEMPVPTLDTYAPDLQYFLKNNVEGLFIELQAPATGDLRDLKIWTLSKLLEDPAQDPDALVRRFTNGYYGAGGTHVYQYLEALRQSVQRVTSEKGAPEVTWFTGTGDFTYLTPEFLQQAQQLFDRATAAVAGNATLTQRVRNARAPIDFATLMFYQRVVEAWTKAGKSLDTLPLKRDVVGQRLLLTRNEQIDRWHLEKDRDKERKKLEDEIQSLTSVPLQVALPAQLAGVPIENIHSYDFRDADPSHGGAVTHDATAPSQYVSRLPIADALAEKFKLPTAWGVYSGRDKKTLLQSAFTPEGVPGPGYNWYKLGEVAPTPHCYVFFTWSWRLQFYISAVAQAKNPNQKYEVWANVKFEGPLFPHGKAGEENAVSVDRVILVKR